MVSFTINLEIMSSTHYFKVNCKTNHLAIIDIVICQSIFYTLVNINT